MTKMRFTDHHLLRPALIGLASVVVCLLVYGFASGKIIDWSLDKASNKTGRTISADSSYEIDWGWPVTGIHLHNFSISNFSEGSEENMFFTEKAFVSINLKSLLMFNMELPEITLDKPQLLLEKSKEGNANWNLMDNASGSVSVDMVKPDDRGDFPEIGQLLINGGVLHFKDDVKGMDLKLDVETIAGSAQKDSQLHFKGDGTYKKQPFKLDITGGSVFELRNNNEPYPVDIAVQIGDTSATLKGTMLDPTQFKGMDTELMLKGADAASLFNIVGIALPPTPPYNLKGQLSYKDNVWFFDNFKGRMGGSDLSGSVKWDTSGDRPMLSGDFVSKKLNFVDLGGFVGAKKAVVQKGASQKQIKEAQKAEASPYVIPETPLDISRLKSMDAQVTFTGKKLISDNLPLDDFYMKVDLDNSLLKLEPLRFGTAKGDIEAFLDVNARQEPVKISGDFKFRRLALKPMFEPLATKLGKKNFAEGYIGGTAKLAGTGKSLREMLASSKGDVGLGMEGGRLSNLLVELLGLDVAEGLGFFVGGDQPVPVRCVVADFGVSNGLMQVRQFVIDTNDSNVRGKGHIDLKGEKLDLTLQTFPKDNTLVSLRSPLHLQGTLKEPKVNLTITNIAVRGAIAAAASVIAAPAALIAFVEQGLGKDSPCNQMIRDMSKNTGTKQSEIPKNRK